MFVTDRGELAKSKGDLIKFKCKFCQTESDVHVDDVKAKPSKLISLIAALALGLGVFLAIEGLDIGGQRWIIISTVPVTIFILLFKGDQNRVARFNRYKLRR